MWRKVVDGVFPQDGFNVSWSPDDDPLYVAKAILNGVFILGSVRHGEIAATFCNKGEIVQHSSFYILCGNGFDWKITDSTKRSPKNAFMGALNSNLQPLRVGRTAVNGKTLCGQIDPTTRYLHIEAYGVECSFRNYQVLVINSTDFIPQLNAAKMLGIEFGKRASSTPKRVVKTFIEVVTKDVSAEIIIYVLADLKYLYQFTPKFSLFSAIP